MMSSECNFDFASQIDCCGGVMWFWHRKMTAENHGLEVVTAATKVLTVDDLPANWRDHIDVVSRRRSKIRVNGVTETDETPFETLTSSRKITPLDASHKAQIDELQRSGYTTLWIPDHHLLQTHTKALEALSEGDAYQRSFPHFLRRARQGNAKLLPLPRCQRRVASLRFSPGISEAETWEQDATGWTNCYFNRAPDLHLAAKSHGRC